MPGITTNPNTKSVPIWAKDFGGRDHIVPFPARLNVSEFWDDGGVKVALTAAASTAGVNEVQTVTISATGGTFTITSAITGFAGTTSALAYNATAAVVQAALEQFLGVGNVTVSLSGAVYTITFIGMLGFQNVAVLTTVASALTGGSGTAVVATGTAGVASSSSLTVTALTGPIPVGAILRFNNGASAVVTTAAVTGDTSVAISGLTATLPVGAFAVVDRLGKKSIISGRLCGRTIAERQASSGFGPWAPGDDEVYLLMFTLDDALNYPDAEFYRPNGLVAENYLPDWASWSTAQIAAMRGVYLATTGFGG